MPGMKVGVIVNYFVPELRDMVSVCQVGVMIEGVLQEAVCLPQHTLLCSEGGWEWLQVPVQCSNKYPEMRDVAMRGAHVVDSRVCT